MVIRQKFGEPYPTEAVVVTVPEGSVSLDCENTAPGADHPETGWTFSFKVGLNVPIYGLGETTRPLNKRGNLFYSYNTDNYNHEPDSLALYGSYNFMVIGDENPVGYFFDSPSRVMFDICKTQYDTVRVVVEGPLWVYEIKDHSLYGVVKQFLHIIGPSYYPPRWAFGYGQSHFGYKKPRDFFGVLKGYRKNKLPLDYVCMDIDFLDGYSDFTWDPKLFPDFKAFVTKFQKSGVKLIPIVDAAIKAQPGEKQYDTGIAGNYFSLNLEGKPYTFKVWPGACHFPDYYQPETREWFGSLYQDYSDAGIQGYWNDMNEPALMSSEYGVINQTEEGKKLIPSFHVGHFHEFYNNWGGKKYLHHDVHNAFSYYMEKASNEGLTKQLGHRFLLFSRSSSVGSHRYCGMWTGDNESCWQHLQMLMWQLPSVSMCGMQFIGSDTGGFKMDASKELLARWIAFSAFTPLLRNHYNKGRRPQEAYQYSDSKLFRALISFRYAILPYLYSEYMQCVLTEEAFIRPLAFDFEHDDKARVIDDQLMIGHNIMMTPIICQGQTQRNVYLPEPMTMVKYSRNGFECTKCPQGYRSIDVQLDEIVFFIRDHECVPVADTSQVLKEADIDYENVTLLGDGTGYSYYTDDGISFRIGLGNIRQLENEHVHKIEDETGEKIYSHSEADDLNAK